MSQKARQNCKRLIYSVLYVPEGAFLQKSSPAELNKRTFVTNEACRIYSCIKMEVLLWQTVT